jgi:hypothetical protein
MSQPLSPDVEKLLHDLQPEQVFNAVRRHAAKKLGELSASDLRVVKALIAAMESDLAFIVRKEAAESLRAPAHQEVLQQHPDLMKKALEIQIAPRGRSVTPDTVPSAEQGVAGEIAESLEPAVAPEMEWEEIAKISPVPVTGWRLALAAIYGLVAALALGYLWYLLATETEKRHGYAALVLGLVVGVVVSFMGGGSKDKRYAALGAVLSGVGIAYGEFLLFGLSGSRFVYKLDVMDLLIYGLAVYEGWVMPQRSVSLVRGRSYLVNERNRKPISVVGVGTLVLLLGLVTQVKQDLPDLSEVVLTPQDFPSGFLEIHTEAFGLEAGQSVAGDYEIESAFALMSFEPYEVVWGITVLLPTRVDQHNFGIEMGQKDVDAALALVVEGIEAEVGEILEQAVWLDLQVVGDASVGFTMVVDIDGEAMRLDTVVFRRDAVGAFVFVSYSDGKIPVVTVDDAARILDDHIIEALSAND